VTELLKTIDAKKFFIFVLIFLALTDLAIFLNIPVLRQMLGFIFFTTIPGLLILRILRLNRLNLTETIVLSLGLSIACLMFLGLFIDWAYSALGYGTPLSMISIIISLSVFAVILNVICYMRNRRFSLPRFSFKLDRREKLFLLLPSIFPLLSILGMRLMNTTNNNVIVMALLFLIPVYVVFITVKRHQVPEKVYPPIIFLMSVSIVLLVALRSNHLIGSDTHTEYFFFQMVSQSEHWRVIIADTISTCLSVTTLPTIYNAILNINPEYLFKLLYPLLLSISPLVVYIIAKKYIGNFYAFLASFFFMSYDIFIYTTSNARTNLAILFFALAIMVLFNDNIREFAKRALFIVFAVSVITSHYSSSYIFLFLLLATFLGMKLVPRFLSRGKELKASSQNPLVRRDKSPNKSPPLLKQPITITLVMLVGTILFLWYSQLTSSPAFDSAVYFAYETFTNLQDFFMLEMREGSVAALLGEGIGQKGIPHRIDFINSWISITFIVIGLLSIAARYRKRFSIPKSGDKKTDFLGSKFEVEYLVLSLFAGAILAVSIALPYVFKNYGMDRAYFQMSAVLAPFFVIGGVTVAKWIRLRPNWVLLPIMFLYLWSWAGPLYQCFGVPRSIILNSEGRDYELRYIHDQENYASNWLKDYEGDKQLIYIDHYGSSRLSSQAGFTSEYFPYAGTFTSSTYTYAKRFIEDDYSYLKEGYFYFRYFNTVDGKLLARWAREESRGYLEFDRAEREHLLEGRSRIYDNGGTEIWRIHETGL